MGTQTHGKRSAKGQQGPSKKRKLTHTRPVKASSKTKAGKGKERAYDRLMIPVPQREDDDEDSALEEEDTGMFDEYGPAVKFLSSLDEKGIARSKKEQNRLHQLSKPVRKAPSDDDLPSLHSHSSDEDDWDSGVPSDLDGSDDDGSAAIDYDPDEPVAGPSRVRSRARRRDSDASELSYEAIPRRRRPSWSGSESDRGINRLPIKLPDGRIQNLNGKIHLYESDESSEEEEEAIPEPNVPRDDVATGARFGRPAVADVVGAKSRKARIQAAKEQIAGICQEIVADPENNLGLLRRLHTFSLPEIITPTRPEPVPNDPLIRKLAMLSQLAVFKDVIPGYRIRALTDKEKAEKVSQIVARTREWEQGLVSVYQAYLKSLEHELKAKEGLEDVALRSMCTLLTSVTHFNFRVNLMSAVVSRLSKRSWDEHSDLCSETVITVFRADETGVPSLEIVRLLNRMVKERRFKVHPEVLSCLLHLRLKTELGVRASEAKVEREPKPKPAKDKNKRKKGGVEKQHLSKKAKKVIKERKGIEKEMREAEAEVDREERTTNQTETLKLLFVLYFRILKHPAPTPLLPAALRGVSKFAHLVSVDFFKDLMAVLRDLIARDADPADGDTATDTADRVRLRLACIITAFDLLSGQGEALTVDLSDFIAQLYALILPLSLEPSLDRAPPPPQQHPASSLLFRALRLAFSPRSAPPPPQLAAALTKRLLSAALHWPAPAALQALSFIADLRARAPALDALFASADRTADGVYRPASTDPQLANAFASSAFELFVLGREHVDPRVREAAARLVG
ncbi:nucleolar complex-associated protein-domain-containing protein [Vararia minispora EC-137]|uniref:Nucleolar complex-associated protein-domain-containing protein n=1 Tax=Vararia minispora EC-137 TaxID=1314806 RepID=A0ACB8QG23_9AGAM|nr:nucleolar complex-associated protein-domain-containing protein [Vararia minispora EC-137]